jgi:hypothetical protein
MSSIMTDHNSNENISVEMVGISGRNDGNPSINLSCQYKPKSRCEECPSEKVDGTVSVF